MSRYVISFGPDSFGPRYFYSCIGGLKVENLKVCTQKFQACQFSDLDAAKIVMNDLSNMLSEPPDLAYPLKMKLEQIG